MLLPALLKYMQEQNNKGEQHGKCASRKSGG